MSHIRLSLLVFLGLILSCQPDQKSDNQENVKEESTYPTTGSVERISPALNDLIAEDAEIQVLAEGFEWTEGPVWIADQEALLFSDIPNNMVVKWKEGEGKSEYLKPSGYTADEARAGEPGSNGLLLDSEGNLVLCQHGDRRIGKMNAPLDAPKSEFTSLADTYDGKRFNSPNDATYHSNGDLYFTDPPYGMKEGAIKEIDFQGVYRLGTDGEVTLLTDELSRPNGIALSPDEKTLYVANSDPEKAIWMAFDVQDDGTIANGRVFYDVTELAETEGNKGLPDGLKVDNQGNIFATGPGGVFIFTPEGEHLGTIRTGEATANCGFGNDGSTLYMTADDYLMRIKLKTKG